MFGKFAVASLVGALDQGTTSTRFILLDHDGNEVSSHQLELGQILPRPGWVEHDPKEMWENARLVIAEALKKADVAADDLVAIGIDNQRETTVVWDRSTGEPLYNAIVWQDTRTASFIGEVSRGDGGDLIRSRSGLVPATYFAGSKIRWILEEIEGARERAERGEVLFGTVDSWLVWNLTGEHVTDVTNASRTMLMNIETLQWDDELLALFGVPRAMLPTIRPSTDSSGALKTKSDLFDSPIPVAAILGDQQAAMVGQACFSPGSTKCTYGTGNFVLVNTGRDLVRSSAGLLTTVCYQFDGEEPCYALEGSVAVTGSAVQWLRDQLGVIKDADEIEALAGSVPDTADLYFVPAFSGLYAPYWRPDARGVVAGMARFHTKAHLARATLEAICYQTRDVVDAMREESEVSLKELRVDGGITANKLCMQIQADILGINVVRPEALETTSHGVAFAAGLAVGFWSDRDEVQRLVRTGLTWTPLNSDAQRERGHKSWKKAVERTFDWITDDN
jgi:glycerol kinase